MSPVSPSIAVLAVLAALAAGCGSSQDGATNTQGSGAATTQGSAPAPTTPAGAGARTCDEPPKGVFLLRVTGTDCATGKAVAAAWTEDPSCRSPAGASRYSCRIEAWHCLAVAGERGAVASCSRPGSSIAFLARRRGSPAA